MTQSKGYFAAREPEEAVAAINNKIELWSNTITSNGYLNKLKDMYAAYHGAYFDSVTESHQISFGGDDGELVNLAVNHMRNFGSHMLTMMTSSRPSMECKATNTDSKSIVQTQLGNGLLDYYMREKKLEQHFKDACELAIVLGSGWIKLSWNSTLGDIANQQDLDDIDYLNQQIRRQAEETGQRVADDYETPATEYDGDVEVDVLSPLDVILDLSKESNNHDWIITRSFKNRYDLIAKYPDLTSAIEGIDSKDSLDRISLSNSFDDETDDIPVFEFFHNKTAAMPNGRYIFFASEDAIFYDSDLPYKRIPVYPVYPSRILGTPLGYTSLFDILPLQDAMNSLYSAIMSNNTAFGVQNILNPSGSNIDVNQLGGALNIIDYNPQAGKPEALNLTATSPEAYKFVDQLNGLAETLSGINSVVRGNPEASLRSGAAIGMIQSNAIQFMSGLQASYTYLIENVGLGLLELLQEFANSPRIANIVGESGKSYVKEFKGEDIGNINRVQVDSANPLTKTIAGRTQMADNLLQYQLLQDPQQYINIINTGKIEVGTENVMKKFNLIRGENEGLLMGVAQRALISDHHQKHMEAHLALLDDPIFRQQDAEQMIAVVLDHVMEHKQMWETADPVMLAATQQMPAPVPPPMAPPEGGPQGGPPPAGNSPADAAPPENMEAPANLPPEEQAMQQTGGVPQNVRMPEGFENVALTGAEGMAKVRGQ